MKKMCIFLLAVAFMCMNIAMSSPVVAGNNSDAMTTQAVSGSAVNKEADNTITPITGSISLLLLLSHNTNVTGKVMLEGYLKSAVVCVDISKNGSCEDENRYRTTTDGDGAYSLSGVPNDILAQYNIVAQSTKDTVELIGGKSIPVDAGERMMAPGVAVLSRDSNVLNITPLLSLITKEASMEGRKLEPTYYTIVHYYLGLDDGIDLAVIDYVKDKGKYKYYEILAYLNKLIYDDAQYNQLMDSQVIGDTLLTANKSVLEAEFTDYTTYTDRDTIIAISGASAIKKEIIEEFYGEVQNHIPTNPNANKKSRSLIPVGDNITDPQAYVDVNSAAHFSNSIRGTVIDVVSLIPKAGLIVGTVLDVVWPEEDPTPQLLGMLYRDVSTIIQDALADAEFKKALADMQIIRSNLVVYRSVPSTENFDRVFETAKANFSTLLENQYAHRMLPVVLFRFNIQMFLYKEKIANYAALYPDKTEEDKINDIKNFLLDYKIARDKIFAGPSSLVNRFVDYRNSFIQRSSGWQIGFLTTDCVGLMSDSFTKYAIGYRMMSPFCFLGEHHYSKVS